MRLSNTYAQKALLRDVKKALDATRFTEIALKPQRDMIETLKDVRLVREILTDVVEGLEGEEEQDE